MGLKKSVAGSADHPYVVNIYVGVDGWEVY